MKEMRFFFGRFLLPISYSPVIVLLVLLLIIDLLCDVLGMSYFCKSFLW
jgi:hypothetical protein